MLQKRRELKILSPLPGAEVALGNVESAGADVVIADYDSGLRLSEAAGEARRRVVILTHSDAEVQICRALQGGARGYLLLGCSAEELLDGIRCVREGGVALAPRVASRVAESMKQRPLSAREQGVLRQMMLGQSNKRIAYKFALAEGTVKTHVKSILAKLNAKNRTEAIAIAQRRGLVTHESG